MKYQIHIPKLLEFALNVVCDDVTLCGKQCLISPIPYPLYLRCIMTYADKYDRARYSTYRFYRDIRSKADVDSQIGRLYPNVLDHIVLDDDDVDDFLIVQVAQTPFVDDAAVSIQRFASRCLAADKSEMMVNAFSMTAMLTNVSGVGFPLSKPILDVLLFYGAKLDHNDFAFFSAACLRGMNHDIQQAIENGHNVTDDDVNAAIESGNIDTIKLVLSAYRGRYELKRSNLTNASVQSLELCLSLNTIQRGKHYKYYNIPSFSVLQWILDHDVMEHDDVLIDIARNASHYSGHYFDMLRYLIEQRYFTVPRNILVRIKPAQTTDLGVFDYLLLHGADVNRAPRVLEHSPFLIRYWIDKKVLIVRLSNDAVLLNEYIRSGMTVRMLAMMMDEYQLDVNGADVNDGYTALHAACYCNNYDVVELVLRHSMTRGAEVNKRNNDEQTPYDVTTDDRIKQLLILHGYNPNQRH